MCIFISNNLLYVYIVYLAISKSPKQLTNCFKKSEASVVLNVLMVSFVKSAHILLPFLTVAHHESGTRKTIFWSVIVYSKNVFSQCNLTVQIEQVHDKL